MTKNFFQRHWNKKREEVKITKEYGAVVLDIVRAGKAVRIHVTSPYNAKFNDGAKELLGTWRHRTGVWTFDSRTYRPLLALCNRVYGVKNVIVSGHKGLIEREDK